MLHVVLLIAIFCIAVDAEIKVTTTFFPPGCEKVDKVDIEIRERYLVQSCNRKKTIVEEVEPVQCNGHKDRWHFKEDERAIDKDIRDSDAFSSGRYLNLTNIEHCTVTNLIRSCVDPRPLRDNVEKCNTGQDTCDLRLPGNTRDYAPIFEMTCPEDRIGEAVAVVSESVYLWDPAPKPDGLTLKFHIERPDPTDDESNECAEAEINKPECSTPSSWDTLREKCAVVKNDTFSDKAACGYKIVAVMEFPITYKCYDDGTSINTYVLEWDEEDHKTSALLQHFSLSKIVGKTSKTFSECTDIKWYEPAKTDQTYVRAPNRTCALVSEYGNDNYHSAALIFTKDEAIADFMSQNISYGVGGLFVFSTEAKGCIYTYEHGDETPRVQIMLKWARLNQEAVTPKSKYVFESTGGEKTCIGKAVPVTGDRSAFVKAVKSECSEYFADENKKALRTGTIITEKKGLVKCENLPTAFVYEFDEKEVNYFDQMSSIDAKDKTVDLKYGAFLTVWNIPTDCEIMTETYRHDVTKYGCDAPRWTPNNHYHKGQPVFVSQVFGYENHNPFGIRFDCPDNVKPDFSKMQARLTSTMTLREPISAPQDWIIGKAEESDDMRDDKQRVDNAKRITYVLRGLDKTTYPKACDLKKCDGLASSWFKTPSFNADVEGYYPWDFECSSLFGLEKCDFALDLYVSVSGQKDVLDDEDPQLYMCKGNPKKVRVVWEDKLPQFGWDKYEITGVVLDESTKCSSIEVDYISNDVELKNSPTAGAIESVEACPTSDSGTVESIGKPESKEGKLTFSLKPHKGQKGINIFGKGCSIGKSEVTVVMRKVITSSDGPIKGLYGQYVSE